MGTSTLIKLQSFVTGTFDQGTIETVFREVWNGDFEL